jgi:hypothetical protein
MGSAQSCSVWWNWAISTLMSADLEDMAAELEAKGKDLERRQRELDRDVQDWRSALRFYAGYLQSRGQKVPDLIAHMASGETKIIEFKVGEEPQKAAGVYQVLQKPEYDGYTYIRRKVPPRFGDKRATVLRYIGKATREGRAVTSREVQKATGLPFSVVVNVFWQDGGGKRNLIKRVDNLGDADGATGRGRSHQVVMTELGFDLLRQANLDP